MYVFKKALFLLHALVLRFGGTDDPPIPLPDTAKIPVFSDNVLPSMLIHLGILDVGASTVPALRAGFAKLVVEENLSYLPTVAPGGAVGGQGAVETEVNEGPPLNSEEAYALRAAAVDACEVIVEAAKQIKMESGDAWINNLTLPELDGWLWAVAKEGRLRTLTRFAERGTVFY